MTRLITIPFSHYCEKARWALDHCRIAYDEDGHLPLFHYLASRRAGGGRTVPIVVDGDTVLGDSTDIVAWADARAGAGLTNPEALALEDDFDRELGPATRRWAYFHLLPRRDLDGFLARAVPRWQSTALRVVRPLAVRMLRRGLNITPEGVERSRHKIDITFARVGELLRDGRRFLVGNRFSVADLTFAALAAPVLRPEGHPVEIPEFAAPEVECWRASPAGQFARRLYVESRRAQG